MTCQRLGTYLNDVYSPCNRYLPYSINPTVISSEFKCPIEIEYFREQDR